MVIYASVEVEGKQKTRRKTTEERQVTGNFPMCISNPRLRCEASDDRQPDILALPTPSTQADHSHHGQVGKDIKLWRDSQMDKGSLVLVVMSSDGVRRFCNGQQFYALD